MTLNSRFLKEPPFSHARPSKTAVIFCNLGTPDEPQPKALRRYLAEFLSDPRVVEIPRWIWLVILHGIILRIRPAKSAAKYASIWSHEGSPLMVHTVAQARGLQSRFEMHQQDVVVHPAMRYGSLGIADTLSKLKAQGADRILVLPAYPQYSGTTTASVFDSIYAWASRTRVIPELRFVNRYHDHPLYIDALKRNILAHWAEHGQASMLVMSFHGVPERTLMLGDPYHCECYKTARLLAQALGLSSHQYMVTFQSRFGKAKWLEPYTQPSIEALAKKGQRHIQVVCPGFTSDCLETLEEIAMEVKEAFMHAGGEQFDYIPCLNESEDWMDALHQISLSHMAHWPMQPTTQQELNERQNLAIAQGAKE